MHVRYSTRLTKMIVVCGLFWLCLLLFITMADIWTRSWMGVPAIGSRYYPSNAGISGRGLCLSDSDRPVSFSLICSAVKGLRT